MGGVCGGKAGMRQLVSLEKVDHPARQLLRQYRYRGAPVVLAKKIWMEGHQTSALARVHHKSMEEHSPFLCDEFTIMIKKERWVVLPCPVPQRLTGLTLIPHGVKLDRDRRPCWLG